VLLDVVCRNRVRRKRLSVRYPVRKSRRARHPFRGTRRNQRVDCRKCFVYGITRAVRRGQEFRRRPGAITTRRFSVRPRRKEGICGPLREDPTGRPRHVAFLDSRHVHRRPPMVHPPPTASPCRPGRRGPEPRRRAGRTRNGSASSPAVKTAGCASGGPAGLKPRPARRISGADPPAALRGEPAGLSRYRIDAGERYSRIFVPRASNQSAPAVKTTHIPPTTANPCQSGTSVCPVMP